jgi:hypothetical protein
VSLPVLVFCRLGWYDAMTVRLRLPLVAFSSAPCAKRIARESNANPAARKTFRIAAKPIEPRPIATRSRGSASNSSTR